MNWMKALLVLAVIVASPMARASGDEAALVRMLNVFLAGASVNDLAAHERFWAEDLVYTSSGGSRFGKASILDGIRNTEDEPAEEPGLVYSAQDIQVQLHGNAAVIAFRLLGTPLSDEEKPLQFFNTGTFVKRGGEWRVVAWQATRIPEEE